MNQHIIIDHTLKRIGDTAFADYLCHAYCYRGYCTFERNGWSNERHRSRTKDRVATDDGKANEKAFRFEAGDCMIIARRGDLVKNLWESEDFLVDVIYVTQQFIEISTPQSNYGMRGQLSWKTAHPFTEPRLPMPTMMPVIFPWSLHQRCRLPHRWWLYCLILVWRLAVFEGYTLII